MNSPPFLWLSMIPYTRITMMNRVTSFKMVDEIKCNLTALGMVVVVVFIDNGRQWPSRMFSVLVEGCHVVYSREFLGTVCCTCGQSNTTNERSVLTHESCVVFKWGCTCIAFIGIQFLVPGEAALFNTWKFISIRAHGFHFRFYKRRKPCM